MHECKRNKPIAARHWSVSTDISPASPQWHTAKKTKRFLRQTLNRNFMRFPLNPNKEMTKKNTKLNTILNTILNQDHGRNSTPKGCCLVVVRGIRFVCVVQRGKVPHIPLCFS